METNKNRINYEGVTFRDLRLSDADLIFKWISNEKLRRMTGTRGIPSVESHQKWFDKKINDKSNITHIIQFEETPIGLIGTNSIDTLNGNCEIYLYIGSDRYKGKKLGYYSLVKFRYELLNERKLHKIVARIFSFNEPSIKLFEKCGFVLEGIQKEQVRTSDSPDSYCDLYWYGYIDSRIEK